ncbi:DUF6207 family protein [Streptomyces sp. NPDC058739]|uniref:DUF6207 family protein n=1 Tax=Streptomyces sp. NPDC058739 TaxID=3346618 RepID=UPI0036781C61
MPITEGRFAHPGLDVVEIAAADDETAFAFQDQFAARGPPHRPNAPPALPASGCAAVSACASSAHVHSVRRYTAVNGTSGSVER